MNKEDPTPDFRTLFEATPGLFLVLSPDLKIVAVSNAYLRATKTLRENIIGKGLFEVFPDNPNDPNATGVRNLSASLQRVLQFKMPDAMAVQKYDIPKPQSEGGGFEERYWSPLNSPVLDSNYQVTYIIHRVEDVTEFLRLKQKGAEQSKITEELKIKAEKNEAEIFLRAQQLQELNRKLLQAERIKDETNRYLRSVVENIPNMIFVKDAEELRFIQFNKAGEDLLGYPREELIGKNDYDFFPKPEADFFTSKDRHVIEKGTLVDIPEESINTRLKGVRWLHTKKIPLFDDHGKPVYLLGISEDITERKQAEEQLKESEEQFRATISSAPDAVVMIDETGKVILWNPRAEEIFGWKQEEIMGQMMHEVIMPEPYRDAHLKGLQRFLKTGQHRVLNRTIEITALRKGNIEFPIELSISMIFRHNDHFFIAFIRDNTERKKSEEKIMGLNKELARAKNELEVKVLERTAELQNANEGLKLLLEKLERSNKRLEEFAYMSSHNLRAPLANLTSLVSLYGQQRQGDSIFDKIHYTANQLNGIVNELTELVALDKPAGDKRTVQFSELLKSVKASIESQLHESGTTISTDFSKAASILYFHSHLQSILLNLLTNAVKYRSPDRKSEIKIKTEKVGDFIQLTVADNGMGIDLEKHRNKIFTAFKRLNYDSDGKGLGLYIVKRQVEQYGGKVDVRSQPGVGSEFIIQLKDNPAS